MLVAVHDFFSQSYFCLIHRPRLWQHTKTPYTAPHLEKLPHRRRLRAPHAAPQLRELRDGRKARSVTVQNGVHGRRDMVILNGIGKGMKGFGYEKGF